MVVKVQAESLWKPLRTAVSELLILVGFAGVLVWAWSMFETTLYQRVQKNRFEREWVRERVENRGTAAPAEASPPVRSVTRPLPTPARSLSGWFDRDPLVLGLIEVPRLDMSVVIREGTEDDTLRIAAGHVSSTTLPGESGNFVVLGHRDTLFRPLRGLEKGDRVRVRTAAGEFRYSVDSIQVVPPEEVDLHGAGPEPGITLVTCYPFDFVGPAPRRFVVRGHLESGPSAFWEGAARKEPPDKETPR